MDPSDHILFCRVHERPGSVTLVSRTSQWQGASLSFPPSLSCSLHHHAASRVVLCGDEEGELVCLRLRTVSCEALHAWWGVSGLPDQALGPDFSVPVALGPGKSA